MATLVILMVENREAYQRHKQEDITLERLCELCSATVVSEGVDRSQKLSAFKLEARFKKGEKSLGKEATPPTARSSALDHFALPVPGRNCEEHPPDLDDDRAVGIAYREEIEQATNYLNNRLSVLVEGDKILFAAFLDRLNPTPRLIRARDIRIGAANVPLPRATIEYIHTHAGDKDWVLVLDRLDVWTHTGGDSLNEVGRDLIEVLYQYPGIIVVGCLDRNLSLPDVLKKRFDVCVSVHSVPRPCLTSLVTQAEVARFKPFDVGEFYKNVAGLNVVRLRHALRYVARSSEIHKNADIYRLIRKFKTEMVQNIDVPDVRLDDIGGYDELKEAIRQLIFEINSATGGEEYPELIPRGILFHGPPGTGKTMFSKAIANEMNAVIEIVSGPEIVSKWVGESERNLREVFDRARNNAPAVVVFDEIDAIAASRQGRIDDGASRAANALVNQLLTEMDGFKRSEYVLIIGTTNRPGLVDEALKRPSRFRLIEVLLPDVAGRRAIVQQYLKKYGYHESHKKEWELWADIIAQETSEFSGDELHTVVKEVKRRQLAMATRERMAREKQENLPAPFEVTIEEFGKEVGRLLKSKIQARQEHLGRVRR